MCQVLYKPKGIKLPDSSLLEQTAMIHSDGCGYMVAWEGSVWGSKGLNVEELKKEIASYTDAGLVIHFRLRTSGKKGPTATHPFPFPIVGIRELKELTWQAPMGIAHNGILSGYGRKKLSDTQEYLLAIASFPDLARGVVAFDNRALGIFEAGQKWALMNGSGEVRLLGRWDKTDGIYHSAPLMNWGWMGDGMIPMGFEESWVDEGLPFGKRQTRWIQEREDEDHYGVDEKCKYCKHFSLTPSKIRETCMVCMQQSKFESKFEVKEFIYGERGYQKYLGNHHFVESKERGALPGGSIEKCLADY